MLNLLRDSFSRRAHQTLIGKYLIMQILSYIFSTMKWFGIWRPIDCSAGWRTNLYWSYTLLVIVVLSLTPLTEIVYLVKYVKDIDEITDSAFLLLTEACIFYKVANVLNRRRDIIRFADSLTNEISRPNGPHEIIIQEEFDRRIRKKTVAYDVLVGSTICMMYLGNYLNNVPQRTLSYNACFPFDHSTDIGYLVAYLYQVLAQGIYGVLCVAYDTLFCGLMGQACAQLRILQYRLRNMQCTDVYSTVRRREFSVSPRVKETEERELQRCICHHQNILEFTRLTNEVFGTAVFIQCAISTLVICCSTYTLSRLRLFSHEFATITAYIICMLIQIFLYCWYGNEVMLESMDVSNAVYAMDWTKLKVRTQKNLLILMARTLKPIKITSAGIIVLSLDTYKSLLKLSYSIFNLLQQSSEQ